MSKVLSPFLIDNLMKTKDRIFEQLEGIYKCAFKIKFEMVCCADLFDTIWPVPESEVSHDLVETLQKKQGQHLLGNIAVSLPLVPGIRRYPWDEKLVGHSSFDLEGNEGLRKISEVLCSPVVVIQDP